jgi:FkbH-like protein
MLTSIVIGSTFAAEPLREPISFWLDRLKLAARLIFAPELQLVQNLVDVHSPLNTNAVGLNVVLFRWQDLDGHGSAGDRPFKDFTECLRTAIRTKRPFLIIACPPSPGSPAIARADVFSRWEQKLVREMGDANDVSLIVASEWLDLYPIAFPYEPGGDEFALFPYSDATYAVLGTLIGRKFHMLTAAPYKVIVVDCDDTLWDGACGEEGPRGIRLEAWHLELQQFLRSQLQLGCLICLCSKNNPEDVEAVFRERSDMLLRWEDITAQRINWQPKPENLLGLADELGLATDSFIFIDDNPIECELMRQSLPNVLTLQLPSNGKHLRQFLRRVWAFDRPVPTDEDKQRTSLYQRERQREQLRQNSPTLEEFIAGLELSVEFKPLNDENLSRASQLTFRVNQFNLTAIRRSEAELAQFRRDDSLDGWAVEVSDRFGAYGLVGLILFMRTPDSMQVDSLLLSCRALGRGVEHRMVVELATHAKSLGLPTIDLRFVPSGKNQPAKKFLESELDEYCRSTGSEVSYRIPVEHALALRYSPGRKGDSISSSVPDRPAVSPNGDSNKMRAKTLAWIASELLDGDAIQTTMQNSRRKENENREVILPSTSTERLVATIWADALGVTNVGIRDNFFQLGGDSLAMVRIILRLYEMADFELPIRAFFESPTIEEQLLRFPIRSRESEY